MHLITTLWTLVISVVTVVTINGSFETPDGRELSAGLGCEEGLATYYRPIDVSESVEIHELAHAFDCMDDGELNGSPGHPRPTLYRDAIQTLGIEHGRINNVRYCWWGGDGSGAMYPHAEWYACMVEATGRLR